MIEWIVQTFVVTTLLAVCMWGICRVRQVGPAWKHALWLVLMLKLIMPPLVNWPWTVHHSMGSFDPQTATHRQSPATTTALPNDREGGLAEIDPAAPAPIQIRSAKPPLVRSSAISDWLVPGIAAIWFAGFTIFAFIQIKRIRCLARLLRIAVPAGPDLTSLVREVADHLKAPAVETRIVAGIASPFVWCIYRPVLLWPAELSSKLSTESVRALLAHELAHLKRRDHLVGWLELAAGCLWWWSPVYWCIRHQLRENAELACDAWAIHAMDSNPGVRHAYAEALLSVCESIAGNPKPSNPMPVVGVDTGNRRFLERRLTMIVRDRLPFRLSRSGLLLTVLITLTLLPTWSLSAPAAETAAATAVVAQASPGTRTPIQVAPRTLKEQRPGVQAPQIELGPIELSLPGGQFKVVEPARLEHQIKEYPVEVRARQGGTPGAAASNDGTADTALNRRIDLNFSNATLKTALDYLRDSGDLNLYVPWRMLKSLGVEESAPVNLKLRDVPLRRALGLVLADATADNSLTYFVEDGVVEVTTREAVTTRGDERAFNFFGNRQLFEGGKFINDPSWEKGFTWDTAPVDLQILQLRERVGESIELEVTGQLTGSVWGDGVYTDDSTLGAAAVHAGLLKPGETGILRVTSMPGRPRYEGSTRNGVRSQSFAHWDGSYRLERVR